MIIIEFNTVKRCECGYGVGISSNNDVCKGCNLQKFIEDNKLYKYNILSDDIISYNLYKKIKENFQSFSFVFMSFYYSKLKTLNEANNLNITDILNKISLSEINVYFKYFIEKS